MWTRRFALVLTSAAYAFACAPSPSADDVADVLAYPAPTVAASCTTSPTLCGLALHDLGGGDHQNAFHIVFIGDGYLDDEQDAFAWHANTHAELLQRPDGVFARNDLVVRAPELFHFWRLDVPSSTIEVDDDVLTNTPLGAHLGPPDNCVGKPIIHAIEDRFALALDEASLAPIDDDDERFRYGVDDAGLGDLRSDEIAPWPGDPVRSGRATFVMLSHRSSGRANATPGGNVRVASADNTDVVAHELGHALFFLADEYTEFDTCDVGPTPIRCGPPADISEVHLLERANTSTLHDGAKWDDDVVGSEGGGNRWPCHAHPTDSCLMLGSDAPLCPVCASAAEERFARRRCLADTRPPRVAIEKEPAVFAAGTRALVAASAFDERGALLDVDLAWTIDNEAGEPFAFGPYAIVDLRQLDGRSVRAMASDGTFVQTSSPIVLPKPPGLEDEGAELDENTDVVVTLRTGGLPVTNRNASGDIIQFVEGVARRATISLSPNACVRVMRAGAFVRVNDGPVKVAEAELDRSVLLRCHEGGQRSISVVLDVERVGDPGDVLEVQGFLIDAFGRTTQTDAWRPVIVDETGACDLSIFARRANGSIFDGSAALFGALDPIVVDPSSNAVNLEVRAHDIVAPTLPMGSFTSNGVAIMPVALPTPTGTSLEASVVGVCSVPLAHGTVDAWVASSAHIVAHWDKEAPAMVMQTSLPAKATAWELAIVDDSAIEEVTVAARLEDGALSVPLVLNEPPWRIEPPPYGPLRVTARDVAGNTSTRDVELVEQQPLDAEVVCP